jgi:hypothetical protein
MQAADRQRQHSVGQGEKIVDSIKRERERIEHLVHGRDRPMITRTSKRQGKRRSTKVAEQLSPGIEEAVQLRERWSHKQGTPETLEAVSRTHQGALAQLHANGTIDNEQLEWAAQIANVARSIEADVTVAVASLEARVDQSRSGADLVGEGINRVRLHSAYTDWRVRLPMPKRLVLDMITGDTIGYTVAGRRYGVGKREALRQLMAAINRWPDCVARAYRRISADDVRALDAALT